MVSGIGGYLVMTKPANFFDSFDDSKARASFVRNEQFQLKILKKYFSTMVENVHLGSIWADAGVKNKLEEVKHRLSDSFFDKIYIERFEVYLREVYEKFPRTVPWKYFMERVKEKGEVGLIFNIPFQGHHILHNFQTQPDSVLKKPKIIWPGNAGTDLTLQNLGVFLKEYKPGD